MLEHIGITINEENDIQAFYKDLLGLKEVQKFDLYKDLEQELSYQKGRIQGVPHYTDKKRIKR
ncbi:MAG: hypothetical protein JRC53_05490 [Deltaproteobacteria bacterium]|nr:hypothetical protein [Deltaproteobacteria bacterium]